MKALLNWELKRLLTNSSTYYLCTLFVFLMGLYWKTFSDRYSMIYFKLPMDSNSQIEFINTVVIQFLGAINFLGLLVSLIMGSRAFANEKGQGSLIFFKANLKSLKSLVVAKFISINAFLWLLLSLSTFFPLTLWMLGFGDWSFIVVGYLGLMLNFALFSAFGICLSASFENQALSVFMSFFILLLMWMLEQLSSTYMNPLVSELVSHISVYSQFANYLKAAPGIASIVYYLGLCFLALWWSTIRLEKA